MVVKSVVLQQDIAGCKNKINTVDIIVAHILSFTNHLSSKSGKNETCEKIKCKKNSRTSDKAVHSSVLKCHIGSKGVLRTTLPPLIAWGRRKISNRDKVSLSFRHGSVMRWSVHDNIKRNTMEVPRNLQGG